MKRCPGCRGPMSEVVRDHHYVESGLDFVYLDELPVAVCDSCGEELLAIPAIESLHRTIALAIAGKSARLSPQEIKFLRKYLGLSNTDFARTMGVAPETSSRWASGEAPMGTSADRLLRLLVVRGERPESYPIEKLQNIDDQRADVRRLDLRRDTSARWRPITDAGLAS
jgi:putative zinc finger/helix-turn-helix YgiT family protein